jgi:uncharacterized membrane protein
MPVNKPGGCNTGQYAAAGAIVQHSTGYIGMPWEKGSLLHKAFIAGILLKGVDAVLETAGGVSLFLISPPSLSKWMLLLIRHELSEDPGDFIAGHLAHWAHGWSAGSQFFTAFYLLSHGVVKLFIVVVLLKEKIWAYHTGIIFFFLFIVYQVYRYSFTHSPWLIVLTVFDIAVIYLTWEEYRRVKRSGIFNK